MTVEISRDVLNSIVTYASLLHPREAVLLLRGRVENYRIKVEEVLIPPFAIRGRGFSAIPLTYLPIDFTIVGTVHSHPSGSLEPSTENLTNVYGHTLVIIAYPYRGFEDLAAYTKEGVRLQITLAEP